MFSQAFSPLGPPPGVPAVVGGRELPWKTLLIEVIGKPPMLGRERPVMSIMSAPVDIWRRSAVEGTAGAEVLSVRK